MTDAGPEWSDYQIFLAIAREGGLSPAARHLRRSPATLGRRMLALERRLGRELFVRHDRGYELTAEAKQLRQDLQDVEARMRRLSEPAAAGALPMVKLSAGTWTALHLLGRLDQLLGTPPDLRLRFIAAEAVLDIQHREALIGLRNARPTGDGLAGRKVGRVDFAAYATPDAPERWIKVLADTPSARWLDKRVGRDAICEVTAPRNALDLTCLGHGVALLPTFIGDAHGTLERRGDPVPELSHEAWIVSHHDDRHLPEIRRTLDRLYRVFGLA